MAIYTKTPNGWEAIAQDAKAVSSFGSIVPDGNQTDEGSYTDAAGREWVWYEYSDASKPDMSVTLSGGLYRILVGSGGAWGNYNGGSWYNQGGDVNDSFVEAEAGTYTIQLGHNFYWGVPSTTGIPDTQTLVFKGDNVIAGSRICAMSPDPNNETGSAVPFRDTEDNNADRPRFNGYLSDITGTTREYGAIKDKATWVNPSGIPVAFGGYNTSGGVIIATVVNGGKPKPVQPALTPATIVSAPVKVSGSADPVEWFVKQIDGTRKKITVLPGNTAGGEENAFEVTLSPGALPGIMVGSGGPGGYTNNGVWTSVGAGGAGGVIGVGANVPVILPRQEETTYTIKVGSTSTFTNENDIYLYGQNTTIAVQGQEPFIAALGGGSGVCYRGGQYIQPHQGASGGGGSIGSAEGSINPYWSAGKGTPGQGHDGGMAIYNWGGAGGGYSSPGEGTGYPYSTGAKSGGSGFNLKDSLSLDGNDAATVAFLDAVTAGGWIAGGGGNLGATPIHGGGAGTNGNAQDFTGGGGGAGSGYGGTGGCGMVLLIEDTES